MADRIYSQGDRTALIALSAGRCYWPGCSEKIVRRVDGKFRTSVDIAHIHALNSDGERYDPNMTHRERNSFDNLIFLCRPHHQAVDERGAAKKYTVEVLQGWKEERERNGIDQLEGIRDLTEDRLQEIINEALSQRDRDVNETVERLRQSDAAAAAVLQDLRTELEMVRSQGSVLDPDMVTLLHSAARDLINLGDVAASLQSAASELGDLGDKATVLAEAASNLRVEESAAMLNAAAERIQAAVASAQDLRCE